MRSISKKAVSTLIASVLLVGLSVVIGALIITWSKNFTVGKAEAIDAASSKETECSMNTGIAFVELDDEYMVCYDSSGIAFTVQNVGSVNLTGIKVSSIAPDGSVENSEQILIINPREAKRITIPNFGISGSSKLSIIPMIAIQKTNALCINKMLTIESVGACS